MTQHDILINTKSGLEWVTGLFNDDLNDAITLAVTEFGPATYVGHKTFSMVDGEWVEVA